MNVPRPPRPTAVIHQRSPGTTTRRSRLSVWDSQVVVISVAVFRIICLIIWSGCIIYGTRAVYLAGEEYPPPPQKRHLLFDFLPFRLSRGRDGGDDEWNTFLRTLMELGYWYLLYIFTSYCLVNSPLMVRMLSSIILTCGFATCLMGWKILIFLFQLPVIYCSLMNTCRSRWVVWGITIFGLWLINFDWIIVPYMTIGRDQWDLCEYWFQIIAAWHFTRCLSFCMDNWDVPDPSLWNLFCYCFYFPTAFTGPIILYSTFERDILQQQGRRGTSEKLFRKILYVCCTIFLCEVILHVLHFKRLAGHYFYILPRLNLWALGGIIFWFGQFFMLKYMVIYGIGTHIAEYEGLVMPPLPKCPSHIHRYSVIWKDFDRGLYDFLVKYTYVPSIKSLDKYKSTKGLHPELKKLIASVLTFCFIYIWHGSSRIMQVWILFNFIGISIERIGTFLKRKIDSKLEVHPFVWDFVLEPMLTVPLAAMSILNSAVFLISMEAAKVFLNQFYNTCVGSYTIPILFCLTHVAVGIRTLPVFFPKLMICLKSVWKINSQ